MTSHRGHANHRVPVYAEHPGSRRTRHNSCTGMQFVCRKAFHVISCDMRGISFSGMWAVHSRTLVDTVQRARCSLKVLSCHRLADFDYFLQLCLRLGPA